MSRKSVRKFHLQVLLGLYVGSVAFRGERYPCAASQAAVVLGHSRLSQDCSALGRQYGREWVLRNVYQAIGEIWRQGVISGASKGCRRDELGVSVPHL